MGIAPKIGYHFSDRWASGISGGIGTFRSTTNSRNFNWSTAIFGRYALPIGFEGRLMLWAELDARWTDKELWMISPAGRNNINTASFASSNLSSGLLFFPKKKLGIEVGIGSLLKYERSIFSNGNLVNTGVFSFLSVGNTVPQIGVYYYFNR